MIKAIIYDMDDLMVNSDPLHKRAWDKLLSGYGKTFSDVPEEMRIDFIGKRVIDVSAEIIDVLELDVELDVFYKKRLSLFLEIVKDELEMMPGLIDSLNLAKRNGLKIALASSGAMEYIDIVLDRFSIRDFFEGIVSGDDVSIGKPHPETYTVASSKLGFSPEECVVLEDAKNGIAAAKAAGCYCIGIVNTFTAPQDRSEADLVLGSLEDLTIEKIRGLSPTTSPNVPSSPPTDQAEVSPRQDNREQ